jgi:hypothetical protein
MHQSCLRDALIRPLAKNIVHDVHAAASPCVAHGVQHVDDVARCHASQLDFFAAHLMDADQEKLAALLVRVALRVVEELKEQADEKQAEALEAQAAAERVRRWALG